MKMITEGKMFNSHIPFVNLYVDIGALRQVVLIK